MEPTDLTIEILKSIRDEVRSVRDEVRQTNGRLDDFRADVNARFETADARSERMENRQVATELRLATELVAVASAVREVRDELRSNRGVHAKLTNHEHRIEALEKRTG